MPGRTREAWPGAWRVQGFGVSPGHAERGRRGRGARCGGVVVEVDTALEPERGDLVACSTADDCPSAPQIARIRRVDAEAGRCRCSRWTRP